MTLKRHKLLGISAAHIVAQTSIPMAFSALIERGSGPHWAKATMNRREIVTLLGGAAAAWPSAARAQQPQRMRSVGVLMGSDDNAEARSRITAFVQALQELGWSEGGTVQIDLRWGGLSPEGIAAQARELVQLKPDVIFAGPTNALVPLQKETRTIPIVFVTVSDPLGQGFVQSLDVILAVNTPAVQAAKKATQAIPIVMTRVADPIKLGIVPSLSHPSGNITVLNFMPDELSGKRLQMLKEIFPSLSHVAVLWYGANPGMTLVVRGMEAPSRESSIELLLLPVNGPDDFFKAFETAKNGHAEALVVVDDALVTRYRLELLDLATKHSLPVVSLFKPFARPAPLLRTDQSTPPMYRRAAYYVDRILKGAKPADLPVDAADQVRAGHQPQDRQGARPRRAADAARPRRRGDRMSAPGKAGAIQPVEVRPK